MSLNRKNVVVVGAGIGGMAAAVLFARAGCEVTLLERAERIGAVGAGILLQPNGLAVLTGLGLDAALHAAGHRVDAVTVQAPDGRTISTLAVPDFGHGLDHHLAVRRSVLHETLLAAVHGEPGVDVRLGVTVTAAAPGSTVRTGTGEHIEADIVVGADGTGSVIRDRDAFGSRTRSSHTYVRGLATMPDPGTAGEYWTPLGLFGGSPVDDSTRYFYASAAAPPVCAAVAARDLDALRRIWAAALPATAPVLDAVATFDDLLVNQVVRVHCRRWHHGRRVLIGDAAHAMAPTAGQGANSALLDAAVLVDELSSAITPEAGLQRYAARRMAAVRAVAGRSDQLARIAHLRSPLARGLRDTALRALGARKGAAERLVRAGQQEDPADLLAVVGALAGPRRPIDTHHNRRNP